MRESDAHVVTPDSQPTAARSLQTGQTPKVDWIKTMATQTLTTRQIAPDDMKIGDYVAITHEYCEFIDRYASERHQQLTLQRVETLYEDEDAGTPLLVMRICLPFVLVRKPDKQYVSVDIRRFKLVKLDDHYALDAIRFIKKASKHNKSD